MNIPSSVVYSYILNIHRVQFHEMATLLVAKQPVDDDAPIAEEIVRRRGNGEAVETRVVTERLEEVGVGRCKERPVSRSPLAFHSLQSHHNDQ